MSKLTSWLTFPTGLLLPLLLSAQGLPLLPPETRLVAVSGAPAPTQMDFNIASTQSLVITLTDFQVPAALDSVTLVVTQGGAIVGTPATLAPPATSAQVSIPAAMGDYTWRVIGAPNSSFNVGTFGVCVAPTTNPAGCIQTASGAGNISAQSTSSNPTLSTVSMPLTVTAQTQGTYTLTFADDQFPVALAAGTSGSPNPNVALFQAGLPACPSCLGIQSGTMISLSPGTYTLLAIAQADSTAQAGLYGIKIAGPAGVAPLLDASYAVGLLAPAQLPSNPSAQSLTLKVTDFAFPAALASAQALATAGSTVLGSAAAGGVSPITNAPAGPLQVWTYGAAGTDAGTFEVDLLTSGSGSLLTSAFGVNKGNSQAFAYVTPSLAAGAYQAIATDFGVTSLLQTLKFAVVQNDQILAQSATAGTLSFTASPAPVVLLANAATAANGNGLFDINVQTIAAAPILAFDRTQGVSLTGLFDVQTVQVGTAGNYAATLTDLMFPAALQDLELIISSGGNVLGKILGGGTIASFPAAAGPIQLTFVATPGSQQLYGMYAIDVVSAAPTVTLTASPNSVPAGSTTTLSWTTSNATSCNAAGGTWTGNPSVGTGSISLAVTTTTTFTLTCSGPGGSAAATATVTTTGATGSSHSGGGQIDAQMLWALAVLVALRWRFYLRGRDV